MVADNSNDFQRYLESIGAAYKDWWRLYTLTDAVGKQQVEREKLSSVFDFGLMVQRVKPEQPERGEAQEKTERLPVLEGLQKYASDHVLLVGRPGSGKSTALTRLLLEEATKPLPEVERRAKSPPSLVGKGVGGLGQIPVLVELRQYKTSVLDLIREFLMRHRLRLDSREIETLLFEGRFLLLIDGLNELPSEEARRDLNAFRQNYAAMSMIFTTRDLGVGGDLGIEKKLEMQPLTEAQMQQFVRAYLPEQGDLMLRQLRNRLREMGQTPLLLWMLCELFRQTGNIPPNLGLVFRCFAQSYDRKIKGDVPVSQELRRWLPESLQQLALVMMQGETLTELRVTISRREAEAVLTTFLQGKVAYPANRAKEWLEDLLENHLIQLDSSHQIQFRHQLLQEYYAAESLLRQLPQISDDRLKRDYLNYLKWTEPLALMLALVDDEAEAIRVVKLALAVDLQLGARLAGEVQLKFQEKTVGLVIALDFPQLLKVEFLGITRSDCAILTLRQALNDEDSWVRRRAAVALGKIGNPEAVAVLIQALNDEDSWVRRNTANALEEIGSEAAVEALRIALNHEDSFIRMKAALALGNISSEAAVEVLRSALND
jgi:predicted NACHT family NTPase